MFKHILVPLDGSRLAESALPVASFLAERLATKVTLIHAIEKDVTREIHGQRHLSSVDEATTYLIDTARTSFSTGVEVDYHVHTEGVEKVSESIVAHADELRHDLIVMCSHGRGRALHLILGSIAQKVISIGSIPVLIVHPDENETSGEFSCKTILVPLDGEPDHEKALPVSRALAKTCGSTLVLIRVVPSLGTVSGHVSAASRFMPSAAARMFEMAVLNAEEYLSAHQEALLIDGVEVSAHVLRGDPAAVILDAAQKSGSDLVVLATHGREGMSAFWEGSVAHNVCSRQSSPLLLIPVKRG